MDLDGIVKPIRSIVDRILGKDEDEEDKKKRKFATG
jgi:hypothetical protein